MEPANLDDLYSGEEYYGKYLDLHSQYEEFVNLPHISRVDYITYLSEFRTNRRSHSPLALVRLFVPPV